MVTKFFMPDSIGFVECLDVFGDDLTVVNAARVSFHKESNVLSNADTKLINYLAAHDHVSPFFHPQVRFRIKMPIFVAREWYRHTIGFARNEVSRRYVDSPPECWVPAPDDIRERDPKLKQGSKATAVQESAEVWKIIDDQTKGALDTYTALLKNGVAPEIARAILPQSMYTEFIETGSLAAYARLCALRLGPDAQKEIRIFAGLVDKCLAAAFPVAWKALQVKFGGDDSDTSDKAASTVVVSDKTVEPKNQEYDIVCLIIDSEGPFTDAYNAHRMRWKETIKCLPANVKCYFIRGVPTLVSNYIVDEENNTIYCKCAEDYAPGIINKTMISISAVLQKFKFNYILRTNLSSHWKFAPYLDVLKNAPKRNFTHGIVSYAHDTAFVSGAGILMSRDVAELVSKINIFKYAVDLPDDIVIGKELVENGVEMCMGSRANFEDGVVDDRLLALYQDILVNDKYYHYRIKSDRGDNEVKVCEFITSLMNS